MVASAKEMEEFTSALTWSPEQIAPTEIIPSWGEVKSTPEYQNLDLATQRALIEEHQNQTVQQYYRTALSDVETFTEEKIEKDLNEFGYYYGLQEEVINNQLTDFQANELVDLYKNTGYKNLLDSEERGQLSNFSAATFNTMKGMTRGAIYHSLFQQDPQAARAYDHELRLRNPTREGMSEFVGETVGSLSATVAALAIGVASGGTLNLASGLVMMGYFGAVGMGESLKKTTLHEYLTGDPISRNDHILTATGYAAAETLFEGLNLKFLRHLGKASAKRLGSAVASQNRGVFMKEFSAITAASVGENTTQEALTQVAQNASDYLFAGIDTPTYENVGRAAAGGALAGLLLGAPTGVAAGIGGSMRQAEATRQAETQQTVDRITANQAQLQALKDSILQDTPEEQRADVQQKLDTMTVVNLDEAAQQLDDPAAREAAEQTKRVAEILKEQTGVNVLTVSGLRNAGAEGRQVKGSDTIFLDLESVESGVRISGHETYHILKEKMGGGELFTRLENLIDQNKATFDLQSQKLNALRQRAGLPEADVETLRDEFGADFFGEQFQSREFWETMLQTDQSLFERVMNTLTAFMRRLAGATNETAASAMMSDLQAAQKLAQDIYLEAVRANRITPSTADATEAGASAPATTATAAARGVRDAAEGSAPAATPSPPTAAPEAAAQPAAEPAARKPGTPDKRKELVSKIGAMGYGIQVSDLQHLIEEGRYDELVEDLRNGMFADEAATKYGILPASVRAARFLEEITAPTRGEPAAPAATAQPAAQRPEPPTPPRNENPRRRARWADPAEQPSADMAAVVNELNRIEADGTTIGPDQVNEISQRTGVPESRIIAFLERRDRAFAEVEDDLAERWEKLSLDQQEEVNRVFNQKGFAEAEALVEEFEQQAAQLQEVIDDGIAQVEQTIEDAGLEVPTGRDPLVRTVRDEIHALPNGVIGRILTDLRDGRSVQEVAAENGTNVRVVRALREGPNSTLADAPATPTQQSEDVANLQGFDDNQQLEESIDPQIESLKGKRTQAQPAAQQAASTAATQREGESSAPPPAPSQQPSQPVAPQEQEQTQFPEENRPQTVEEAVVEEEAAVEALPEEMQEEYKQFTQSFDVIQLQPNRTIYEDEVIYTDGGLIVAGRHDATDTADAYMHIKFDVSGIAIGRNAHVQHIDWSAGEQAVNNALDRLEWYAENNGAKRIVIKATHGNKGMLEKRGYEKVEGTDNTYTLGLWPSTPSVPGLQLSDPLSADRDAGYGNTVEGLDARGETATQEMENEVAATRSPEEILAELADQPQSVRDNRIDAPKTVEQAVETRDAISNVIREQEEMVERGAAAETLDGELLDEEDLAASTAFTEDALLESIAELNSYLQMLDSAIHEIQNTEGNDIIPSEPVFRKETPVDEINDIEDLIPQEKPEPDPAPTTVPNRFGMKWASVQGKTTKKNFPKRLMAPDGTEVAFIHRGPSSHPLRWSVAKSIAGAADWLSRPGSAQRAQFKTEEDAMNAALEWANAQAEARGATPQSTATVNVLTPADPGEYASYSERELEMVYDQATTAIAIGTAENATLEQIQEAKKAAIARRQISAAMRMQDAAEASPTQEGDLATEVAQALPGEVVVEGDVLPGDIPEGGTLGEQFGETISLKSEEVVEQTIEDIVLNAVGDLNTVPIPKFMRWKKNPTTLEGLNERLEKAGEKVGAKEDFVNEAEAEGRDASEAYENAVEARDEGYVYIDALVSALGAIEEGTARLQQEQVQEDVRQAEAEEAQQDAQETAREVDELALAQQINEVRVGGNARLMVNGQVVEGNVTEITPTYITISRGSGTPAAPYQRKTVPMDNIESAEVLPDSQEFSGKFSLFDPSRRGDADVAASIQRFQEQLRIAREASQARKEVADSALHAMSEGATPTTNRAKFGNEPQVRALSDAVDAQMEASGYLEAQTVQQFTELADRRLEQDFGGDMGRVMNAFIGSANESYIGTHIDIHSAADTILVRRAIAEQGMEALRTVTRPGGLDRLASVAVAMVQYRGLKTEQARALMAGRDPIQNPVERARQMIFMTLTSPSAAVRRKLRVANYSDKIRLMKKDAAKTQKAIQDLKDAGMDFDSIMRDDELLSDPEALAAIMRAITARKASLGDMGYEVYRNFILSALPSQSANFFGNMGNFMWEYTAQRMAEATVNMITGNSLQGTTFGELVEMYKGVIDGLVRGYKNALISWRTEVPIFDTSQKFEMRGVALPSAVFEIGGKRREVGGRQIRYSQRMLLAADEMAKSVIVEMETRGQAYRSWQAGRKTAPTLREHINRVANNPASEERWQADQKALELTFQTEPGEIASALLRLRESDNSFSMKWAVRMMLPFITTPTNIVKIGLRKTPLGILRALPATRKARLSAPDSLKTSRAQAEALRRGSEFLLSMGMVFALMRLVEDDEDGRPLITGSSMGGAEGQAQYRYAPPQSFRISKDTWFSFSRIEPFATTITLLVDMMNAAKDMPMDETNETLSKVMRAAVAPVRDKTFMRQIGDLIRAVEENSRGRPDAFLDWGLNFAAAVNPNFFKTAKRATMESYAERRPLTPIQRFGEALWPGSQAGPKVSMYGTIVDARAFDGPSSDFIYRSTMPFRLHRMAEEMNFDRLIFNYNANRVEGEAKWYPSAPNYKFKARGVEYVMTPAEYTDFLIERGQHATSLLRQYDLNYENPTIRDIKLMQKAFRKGTQTAKRKWFNEVGTAPGIPLTR